jgi:hypothetical protein
MRMREKLQAAAESLAAAADVLGRAAEARPALAASGRAFGRMAKAVKRPLRAGIFGETNSGKSSLANTLAGAAILPAHPVKNTTLPVLLTYAPVPSIAVLYGNSEIYTFPENADIPQILADLLDCGGASLTLEGNDIPLGDIIRLEAGQPSELLRSVEIVDFPASSPNLANQGIDAAIWTTVATQAWRGSEQAQWLELPQAVRSRSLLAVTYCDMIAGGQRDLKRLQTRLELAAMPHFQKMCFVEAGDKDPAAAASGNANLFALLENMVQEFSAGRLDKAMALVQRTMDNAITSPGAANASRMHPGLAGGQDTGRSAAEDWLALLARQHAQAGFDQPQALIREWEGARASRPKLRLPIRKLRAAAASQFFQGHRRGVAAGAAIALAGTAVSVALILTLSGTEPPPIASQPPAVSEAVEAKPVTEPWKAEPEAAEPGHWKAEAAVAEENPKAEAGNRWTAEAEADEPERLRMARAGAEGGNQWKVETEAAEAERRRIAKAGAAEASRRRKAEAEAAEAERRRIAKTEAGEAEKRRKAEAEPPAAENRAGGATEAAAAPASPAGGGNPIAQGAGQ